MPHPNEPEYVPSEDPVTGEAPPALRGRGAAENPTNRFVPIAYEPEPQDEEGSAPGTRFFRDSSRSIITTNTSPDVGFDASINPYRGCENGCSYCYARPYHEYLGLSAGLDFETMIFVKEDAPDLLRKELASPKWEPKVLALSGVTDAYQPVEKKLGIARRCLEVLAEFRNPVSVITKRHDVTRDADLLAELARHGAAHVHLSITTLDDDLRRKMEPRTSSPERRLAAIEALARGGVPTGVIVGPVIPGLTEHELPRILEAAAQAGAVMASYIALRLPHAVAPLFEQWLSAYFPDRKEKVLNRIRAIRGGKLNDPRFGTRMRGEGIYAEEIRALFEIAKRKSGLVDRHYELSTDSFRRPGSEQLGLF